MIGALLFGLAVAGFFGGGFALVWRVGRELDRRIDAATTLPAPQPTDDVTGRIDPEDMPHDLPRRGGPTTWETYA